MLSCGFWLFDLYTLSEVPSVLKGNQYQPLPQWPEVTSPLNPRHFPSLTGRDWGVHLGVPRDLLRHDDSIREGSDGVRKTRRRETGSLQFTLWDLSLRRRVFRSWEGSKKSIVRLSCFGVPWWTRSSPNSPFCRFLSFPLFSKKEINGS